MINEIIHKDEYRAKIRPPFTDTVVQKPLLVTVEPVTFEPCRKKSPMEIERDQMMQKIFDKNKVFNTKEFKENKMATRDVSFESK